MKYIHTSIVIFLCLIPNLGNTLPTGGDIYNEYATNFFSTDSTKNAQFPFKSLFVFSQKRGAAFPITDQTSVTPVTILNRSTIMENRPNPDHNPIDSTDNSTMIDGSGQGYWKLNQSPDHFTWPDTLDFSLAICFRPYSDLQHYYVTENGSDFTNFKSVALRLNLTDLIMTINDGSASEYIKDTLDITDYIDTYLIYVFTLERDIGGGNGRYRVYVNGKQQKSVTISANTVSIIADGDNQNIGLKDPPGGLTGTFDLSFFATAQAAWTPSDVRKLGFLDDDWDSLNGDVFREDNPSTKGFVFHQGMLSGETLSHDGIPSHPGDTTFIEMDVKTYSNPVNIDVWFNGQPVAERAYAANQEFTATFVVLRNGSDTLNVSVDDSLSFRTLRACQYGTAPPNPPDPLEPLPPGAVPEEECSKGSSYYNLY